MARIKATDRSERTEEITGFDANMDQAEVGDAGNGADPFGADYTGGLPQPLEDSPDEPDDILPDQIGRFPRQGEPEEEMEVTARPAEPSPFDLSELP